MFGGGGFNKICLICHITNLVGCSTSEQILLFPDKTPMHVQPGCAEPESRLSPGARDVNSHPPSSNGETPTFVRQLPATSSASDLMNAALRRTKTRRKESAIVRQLTGPTVGQEDAGVGERERRDHLLHSPA